MIGAKRRSNTSDYVFFYSDLPEIFIRLRVNQKFHLSLRTEKINFKDMKTISVQVSDVEYDTFGLSKDRMLFAEFAEIIQRQRAKQNEYEHLKNAFLNCSKHSMAQQMEKYLS